MTEKKELTAPKLTAEQALVIKENPKLIFQEGTAESFFEYYAAEMRSIVTDATTAKGRKDIKSLAHQVARTKTAIEEAGKEISAVFKDKARIVDNQRNAIKEKLQALQDEIKGPALEWEAEDEKRISAIKAQIESMGTVDYTVEAMEAKLEELRNDTFDYQEFSEQAALVRVKAIESLEAGIVRRKEEIIEEERLAAERAELEKLRKEKEERERKEREGEIRRQAVEAEKERIEREAREKVEKANREAAEAEERKRKAEADAKAAEERARAQKLKDDEVAQQKAETMEQIAEKLSETCFISIEEARNIVKAIADGKIAGLIINMV